MSLPKKAGFERETILSTRCCAHLLCTPLLKQEKGINYHKPKWKPHHSKGYFSQMKTELLFNNSLIFYLDFGYEILTNNYKEMLLVQRQKGGSVWSLNTWSCIKGLLYTGNRGQTRGTTGWALRDSGDNFSWNGRNSAALEMSSRETAMGIDSAFSRSEQTDSS